MLNAPFSAASTDAASDCLVRSLNGDEKARNAFFAHHYEELVAISKRIAPDLAFRGLEEDVVGEFALLLLSEGPEYYTPSPDLSVWTHLGFQMRTAAETVRSQNPRPFQPKSFKRTKAGKALKAKKKAAAFSVEAAMAYEEHEELTEVPAEEAFETLSATPFARGIRIDPDFQEAEVRVFLESAQKTAPNSVYNALDLIVTTDLNMTEVARLVGQEHRTTLQRRIKAWGESQGFFA